MSKLEDLEEIININLENMDISNEAKSKIIRESASVKKKIMIRKFKLFSIPAAAIILLCVMVVSNLFGRNSGPVVKAQDLMKNVVPANVESTKLSDDFIKSQADFSIDLFKKSIKSEENSLISPISVYLALAMTANGADGNTLKEFESLLGKYNLNMADINRYCNSYTKNLCDVQSGKLEIANSIWYSNKKGLNVSDTFLQTNANYYGASVYKADFGSQQTVTDINSWVKSKTGNLIDKIIDKTNPNTVMYLISALYFEAEWYQQYEDTQLKDGDFKLFDGKTITTEFMHSTEYQYIKDDMAQGFIKRYKSQESVNPNKDKKFSFVAILPNEGVSIDSYINSLTGDKFLSLIKNKSNENVITAMPKFKSEYSTSLVEPLKAMGLRDCFDEGLANFSKMGSSTDGNLYISDVNHKTFIQVDNIGTKAGAVASVEIVAEGRPPDINKEVILDRPFVYAIIDNETSLPIFIGTMYNPGANPLEVQK